MRIETGAIARVKDLLRWDRQTQQTVKFSLPPRIFIGGPHAVAVYPAELLEITSGLTLPARDLIYRAYEKACLKFAGKIRKSGRLYIDHALETAHILRQVFEVKDTALLAAGLLHDLREDTDTTYEELKNEFGVEVADLVEGETKLSKALEKEKREVENLKQWIKALGLDPRVALLKAADNLSNMSDQWAFPKAKQEEHARETMEIYGRIMDAMGIWEMRVRLEDAAIKYLFPEKFEQTVQVYAQALHETSGIYDKMISGMTGALLERGLDAKVELRQRTISEVFRAMERQKRSLEQLLAENPWYLHYVLVEVKEEKTSECYRALGILRDEVQHQGPEAMDGFKPRSEAIEDTIALPRPNGYRALQTRFFRTGERGELLVTATTEKINNENRLGFVAQGAELAFQPGWYLKNFEWMSRLIDLAANLFSSDDLRQLIGEIAYRMVVYTPEGEKMELPVTSTVLDFAFYKDPARAQNITAVKVNGSEVPLSQRLKANDVVEIVASPEPLAEPNWLSWAKTIVGAERLRDYFRSLAPNSRHTLGLRTLEDKTDNWFLRWADIKDSPPMRETLECLSAKHRGRLAQLINDRVINAVDLVAGRITPEMLITLLGLGEIEVKEFVDKFMGTYTAMLAAREEEGHRSVFAIIFRVDRDKIGIKKRFGEALECIGMNVVQDHARKQKDGSAILTYVFEIQSTIQQRQIENIVAGFGETIDVHRGKEDAVDFGMAEWREKRLKAWRKRQK